MLNIPSLGKICVVSAAVCVLCFPGCMLMLSGVKGSGVSKTELRQTEDFDVVSLSGSSDINIQCGQPTSLSVTIDDNLLEMITTEVKDGTLEVGSTDSYSSRLGLKLDIKTPQLTKFEVSGACDAEIIDCNTDRLELEVSGAGDLTVSGTVDFVKLELSGAGNVDLSNLVARSVSIELSGAASATVNASEKLDVNISGVGSVTYEGDPELTKSVSGLGSVKKIKN